MILVISDLHARVDALIELLKRADKTYGMQRFDKIVFMGDYIGYGEETIRTLDFLRRFREKYTQTVLLKGNWEDMICSYYGAKSEHIKNHYADIMKKRNQSHVLQAFEESKERGEWVEFLQKMPNFYLYKTYCFVHAGIDFSIYEPTDTMWDFLNKQTKKDLLWKSTMYEEALDGWKNQMTYGDEDHPLTKMTQTFLFGHLPLPIIYKKNDYYPDVPFSVGNVMGIDFGASRNLGKLGAVVLKGNGFESLTVPIQSQ